MEPVYNAIYDTYDNIRTVKKPAERLIANTGLIPGQRILDVACGTGWATMEAAKLVGYTGKIIGIDIADKMLEVAREKAAVEGMSNVEYYVGDAEALEFDDASFDAVISALSIFLLRDISKALGEWRRVLKGGGRIAFSSFGVGLLQPTYKLFNECLARYVKQMPADSELPIARTDTPDKCRELLENAGFEEIDITAEQLGFHYQDTADYWQETSSGIPRVLLEPLSPADLERFKEEHLAEVESIRTDEGILNDVPVLFSLAKKG